METSNKPVPNDRNGHNVNEWAPRSVLTIHSTSWTAEVPQTISALQGSCVVVPCKFNYPDPERKPSDLIGVWHTHQQDFIYHPNPSKVMEKFRSRTNLIGNLARKNCSLRINHLQKEDNGQFIFRIEISGFDKFSYYENPVSIDVQDSPASPLLTMSREVKAGETVTATCTVSHSCPTDLPRVAWSHSGASIVQTEELTSGQWRVTSSLTFTATNSDHNKQLTCTAEYRPTTSIQRSNILIVKYAPVSVEIETDSTVVKEGDAVEMQCSSDSNPPAHSYQWYNITGALLSKGGVYKLSSVSRHISAFYCAAINTEGHRNSAPFKISVEYPPSIGVESFCSAKITGIDCKCLVKSSPTSRVQWILADSTVANGNAISSTGGEDSGTVHTLHLYLGLTDMVSCYANNTHGNDTLVLQTGQRGVLMAIYLSGSAATAFVLISVVLGLWKYSRRKERVEVKKNPLYSNEGVDKKGSSKNMRGLEGDDQIYVNTGKHFEEEEELHYQNCDREAVYANT